MNHPFKIIRGGLAEPEPPTKKQPKQKAYASFDVKQAIGDRICARHIADRDKYILKKRSQAQAKR